MLCNIRRAISVCFCMQEYFFPTFSSHVVPFRQFFLGLVEGDVLLPLNLEN